MVNMQTAQGFWHVSGGFLLETVHWTISLRKRASEVFVQVK